MSPRGGSVCLPLFERFWANVDMSGGLLACWPWMGARSRKRAGTQRGNFPVTIRYGNVPGRQRFLLAHRVALCLSEGGLEEYTRLEYAAHRCHNRLCCNTYAHLYWATDAENREDRRRYEAGVVDPPLAWYYCDACGTKTLRRYYHAEDLWCERCAGPVWSLVDVERRMT